MQASALDENRACTEAIARLALPRDLSSARGARACGSYVTASTAHPARSTDPTPSSPECGCVVAFYNVITVPEAAVRASRNPETIRRWIRAGRLPARKVGTQHVIEEEDLDAALGEPRAEGLPERWRWFESGRPAPDPVRALDESRRGR